MIQRILLVVTILYGTNKHVLCDDKEERLERSMEYYGEAELLASEEKFELALPFYRAAVRLSPDYPLFLEKTASVELKLNDKVSAIKRLQKLQDLGIDVSLPETLSLSLGPSCLSDPDFHRVGVSEIHIDTIKRCGTSCLEITDFIALSKAPFIIRNGLHHMQWNISYFDRDSLIANFGHHIVEFYPQNILKAPAKNYQKTVEEVFEYIRYPDGAYMSVDASNPGAYGQWNINNSIWTSIIHHSSMVIPRPLGEGFRNLFSVRRRQRMRDAECAGNECDSADYSDSETDNDMMLSAMVDHFHKQTHWNMILLAEAGAGMFNHQDVLPVGSWQAQVRGSKQWQLCPPLPPTPSPPDDTEKDRYRNCPESFPVTCLQAEVRSGDLIYYPPHFWHSTENTASPSIAVSSTVILKEFESELIEYISTQCELRDKSIGKFKFSDQFCHYIEMHLR
jgi:hypothetical protein